MKVNLLVAAAGVHGFGATPTRRVPVLEDGLPSRRRRGIVLIVLISAASAAVVVVARGGVAVFLRGGVA